MTMDWNRLLNRKRFGMPNEGESTFTRTAFHKDHDRVVFSSSFRRLERKTQVHPLRDNDHIHSRLTHSLEVSCVGRSLGAQVGEKLDGKMPDGVTPADLGASFRPRAWPMTSVIRLLGIPVKMPLGIGFRDPKNQHFLDGLGPKEIKDLQTFEGNAQGLRILTQLEYHRFQGGMRLTYATLGALS